MHSITERLLRALYPARCPVCGQTVGAGEGFVHKGCRERLTVLESGLCSRCGRKLFDASEKLCDNCRRTSYAFTEGRSLFLYDRIMQQAIYSWKYGGRREYTDFFAGEAEERSASWIRRRRIEAIVPVPMHPAKQKKRGYNQAELLAAAIAERTGIPLRSDLLFRVRKTDPQKGLTRQERLANLCGAFSCPDEVIVPERVLLIDDIYTTGSTIHACACALKEHGAQEIFFLTIASGGEA